MIMTIFTNQTSYSHKKMFQYLTDYLMRNVHHVLVWTVSSFFLGSFMKHFLFKTVSAFKMPKGWVAEPLHKHLQLLV